MGMSASQVRLLSLTARMNDVEFKSQQLANTKMRLADESAAISDEYTKGLNKTQIRSVIKNLKMKLYETDLNNIHENSVNIVECSLNNGFIYKNYIVLSQNELFKTVETKKRYVTKYKYATQIKDINKLDKGDYIVHSIHGIGIYNGIKSLTFNNIVKDYIEILYQGSDKIYIPVNKIDTLYKYSGAEGTRPKVNKLGSNEWKKTKNRVII